MQVIRTLPSKIVIAVSGGLDSLVLLHWLNKRRDVIAAHYIHDSDYSAQEHAFVRAFCKDLSIGLIEQTQPRNLRPANVSQEEHWRNGRYSFFKGIPLPVCTGHTLDDAVESYLFTSLNGQGQYMEYAHANVVRPFITTRKSELLEYAITHRITWLEDDSNAKVDFAARNRIRHNIMPEALKVNPGLHNMVKRRIVAKLDASEGKMLNTEINHPSKHVTSNQNNS